MSELAPGWAETSLESLVTFSIGGVWGSSPDSNAPDTTTVAVMRGADYRNWGTNRAAGAATRRVPTKAAESRRLEAGNLVIEVSGGGPTQPVGRVVLIDDAALQSTDLPLILSNFCRRVVLNRNLTPRFVHYQLLYKYLCGDTGRFQTATTNIRNLNFTKYLAETTLAVAPYAEQERIVTAIEEQFSRLDAGVAALARVVARLESFTKSVLLAAVPDVIPATWDMSTVGEAGEVNLGRQRSPKFHSGPSMRPYLRVANVFEDRIDTADVMSMQFSDNEFERYKLINGDVLLNEGQSPHLLGRPAMYRGEPPGVAFTNSLLRFRSGPGVLPEWALHVFRCHLHAKRFMRESQITTNIAHLSAGRFKAVEFPVPPLEDQRRILREVDERLVEIKRVQALVAVQTKRATTFRLSILTAAFSGRLIPQASGDETASVLLNRIVAAECQSSNGHIPSKSRSQRRRKVVT